jgi:hypothetical protein
MGVQTEQSHKQDVLIYNIENRKVVTGQKSSRSR